MPIRTPESAASSTVSEAELIAAAEPDTVCWFDDGNLVLVAGGSKFLVYGGHLARLSPIFKNMFSFPQSPSPERPAVVLYDEPAIIRRFLAAILYTQMSPSLILDSDYETVSALIHVGHKYQIDSILRDGIEFLKAHFPDDFQTWRSSRYRADQKRTWPSSPHVPPRFELVHAIGVVELTHFTETLSILPTALLACTLLSPSEIVNGFTDADGAVVVLSTQDQHIVELPDYRLCSDRSCVHLFMVI
ncbi:hypothetical protein C8Q74DRAFT_330707 [Fomes fomentarius]|nr:hypothetical protein C8Q74DRAFT_330707 [Fomes fomentarius]